MKHLLFLCLFFSTMASAQKHTDTIHLAGHKVILNNSGFPEQIQTANRNILAENIHFHIINAVTHKDIAFKQEGLTFSDTVNWQATSISDQMKMEVEGRTDTSGYIIYTAKLTALQNMSLDDIKLHIPFDKSIAKYMSGLGREKGPRPDTINWKWEKINRDIDGPWVGDENAGLQYYLYNEKYRHPPHKTLQMSVAWDNNGKGGISMFVKGRSMLADNYSGPRSIKKGEVLRYMFILAVNP